MKLKFRSILLTTILAIAGIFSVSSALVNKQIEEAPVAEKAEAVNYVDIYCKVDKSWWTKDSAAVAVHYWGGTETGTTWPGDRGTSVGDSTWQFSIPVDVDNFMFVRVNGTGTEEDWGAKTSNLSFTGDKNLYTITSNSAVWGDPGVTGEWGYKPLDPSCTMNEFYVYDPHNALGGTLANVNVYGCDQAGTVNPMTWPGTHSGVTSVTLGITSMYKISLSESYPTAIINCGDGNNQTGNLTVSNVVGKVVIIKAAHSGKVYECGVQEVSHFNGSGNYPTNGEGYYLVTSDNIYTFTGSTKMSGSTTPYVCQILSFSASEDQGIKVRGFYNDRDDPNIWSFYDGDDEAFGAPDGDANFIFSKDVVVDIYAKFVNGELKFYVLEHVSNPGYYILGDEDFAEGHGSPATPWTFASGIKMDTLSGEGNRASYVLTVSTVVLIRVRECLSLDHGWVNFGQSYSADGIRTVGDNVELQAGTYTLYVNSEGSAYVLRGIPADAFCTTFLSTIAGVCEEDGSTPISSLTSAWSTLSDLWENVISGETGKDLIEDIGFDGGSNADDAHKVVLAYNYIVTKYGTAKCEDFVWGQNISARSAIQTFNFGLFNNSETDNLSTIIIIVASSVALLSVTALSILVIKKRKQKEE